MRTGIVRSGCILAAAVAVLLLFAPTGAAAQDRSPAVVVLASNGVKAALEALVPACERLVGRPVSVSFDTSAAIRRRIDAGEAFDLTVLTADAVVALERAGAVATGSTTVLGQSRIGMAIRAGSARPDITSTSALRQALIDASSVTYASDGATRSEIERMLTALGIADDVARKTTLARGSVAATARVARGESALVMTLVSEILPVAGIALVGPLPPEFQRPVSFAAGVGARGRQGDVARALVAFLAGPEAEAAFTAIGIDR